MGVQVRLGCTRSGLRMRAPRTRVQRHPVHGVLLLDKPLGWSSNDALQKCKWLLAAEKAGHTGTLDPLATGVLPLCFGAATKFSQLHLDANKSYEAILKLGEKTNTGDAEGKIIATRAVAYTAAQLTALESVFAGRISQIPPMYSALKKNGKTLYEYARDGIDVARSPREIEIFSLSIVPSDSDAHLLKLTVRCSKGTYIRTLGEDIGEALGCGGHLVALRRTATGPFDQGQCVTLDALIDMSPEQRSAWLQPVDCLLPDHQRVTLDAENAARFLSGVRRRGAWADSDHIAVYGSSPSALLGTAHVRAGELIPNRLLSPVDIQQILESSSPSATGVTAT